MWLLVAVQLLAAVSAWRLDLSLSSLEQPPLDLCKRGATIANLGANVLRAVPPCCDEFIKLQVHRNLIQELPEGWLRHCPKLQELSVSGNRLSRLPDRLLRESSSLRRLQASRNQLGSLPPQLLTNATALTELDLSHNSLTELPAAFLDTNSQLVELYLQGNSLSSVPERALRRCGRLRQLWLSGNRLTTLPRKLLAEAPQLRVLRLDRNQLTAVDQGAFDNNRQLQLVDLSSNKLTSLPEGLFASAKSLRYLLLRGNELQQVPASARLPQQDVSLDLRDNLLHTVEDFGVFGESRAWLDGNQWHCSCPLEPVIREAGSKNRSLRFREHPLCHISERDLRSFSELDISQCHISGVFRDLRAVRRAARRTVPTLASRHFDKSAREAVPITTTLGAAVWVPVNNSSLTPTSVTEIYVTDDTREISSLEVGSSQTGGSSTYDYETTTSEIGSSEGSALVSYIPENNSSVTTSVTDVTREISSLEVGSNQTGGSSTYDYETTTSEIGSSEGSARVSYIPETTTSVTASTENDSTPYQETTTTQNSQSDLFETSESDTSHSTATTEIDNFAIYTATLPIVSSKTVDLASSTPLGSSAEPREVLRPHNEFDPIVQVLGLTTYSTTTVGGNYNSATTDNTVSSPIATIYKVDTSQTGSSRKDVSQTGNLKTSTLPEDNMYDDIQMH